MPQFTVQNDHWYALEAIHPLDADGSRIFPIFVEKVSPLKSGKGLLHLWLETPNGALRLEGQVLKRTHEQVVLSVQNENIAVIRPIQFEWLENNYPEITRNHQIPRHRNNLEGTTTYLNRVYRNHVFEPLFTNYRQQNVVFRCDGFEYAEAVDLPLFVVGKHLLEIKQKAEEVVKAAFPDWDESQNRIVFEVDFGDENDILTACALRFDGYGYLDNEYGEDSNILDAYFQNGIMPEDKNLQLAMFFMTQRYLMKWGGEQEPTNGKTWRIFRTLFLKVVNEPVLTQYQFREYYLKWLYNYEPFRAQCIEIVQSIHESIAYDDNVTPKNG